MLQSVNPTEKIKSILSSSPFGSGSNAADLIDGVDIFGLTDGVYKIGEVDGETYVEPTTRFGFPNWQSEVCTYIKIEDGYIIFRLGCGVHSADYKFNRAWNLVAVYPDPLPSERFWGDGECDLPNRKKMLLKRALRGVK